MTATFFYVQFGNPNYISITSHSFIKFGLNFFWIRMVTCFSRFHNNWNSHWQVYYGSTYCVMYMLMVWLESCGWRSRTENIISMMNFENLHYWINIKLDVTMCIRKISIRSNKCQLILAFLPTRFHKQWWLVQGNW